MESEDKRLKSFRVSQQLEILFCKRLLENDGMHPWSLSIYIYVHSSYTPKFRARLSMPTNCLVYSLVPRCPAFSIRSSTLIMHTLEKPDQCSKARGRCPLSTTSDGETAHSPDMTSCILRYPGFGEHALGLCHTAEPFGCGGGNGESAKYIASEKGTYRKTLV